MSTRPEAIDLSKITQKYKNKWIALSWDMKKVYASGQNPDEAEKKAREAGHDDAIITKLPSPDVCLVL